MFGFKTRRQARAIALVAQEMHRAASQQTGGWGNETAHGGFIPAYLSSHTADITLPSIPAVWHDEDRGPAVDLTGKIWKEGA